MFAKRLKLNEDVSSTQTPVNQVGNSLVSVFRYGDTSLDDDWHPRRKRIYMDEVRHLYFVSDPDDKKKQTQVAISGTGFKEMFFPKFDAIETINTMFSRARCTSHVYTLKKESKSLYNMKTWNEIYNIFTGKLDADASAANRGTKWHYLIEMYMKKHARAVNFDMVSMEQKATYFLCPDADHPTGKVDLEYTEFIGVSKLFVQVYEQYIVKQGWKPYASEMQMFDESVPGIVAGTADAVFSRTNKIGIEYLLVDWKTVSASVNKDYGDQKHAFYPLHRFPNKKITHYSVQLNLYAYWLKTFYDVDIRHIKAICFNLNEGTFEIVEIVYDAKLVSDIYQFYCSFLNRKKMFIEFNHGKDSLDVEKYPMSVYLPSTPAFTPAKPIERLDINN